MKIFHFSLPIPTVDDAIVNALYGRYSDMSIGSCHEQMYVAFDREASCLESAIDSAVMDLRAMGIHPLRIELDVPELAAA